MEKRHPDFIPVTDARRTLTDAEGFAHNSDEQRDGGQVAVPLYRAPHLRAA